MALPELPLRDDMNIETLIQPFGGLRWMGAALLLLVLYAGFSLAFLFHELGHYFAARAFGIVPKAVHVGHLGPAISFNYAGTDFVIKPIANVFGSAVTQFEHVKTSYIGATVVISAGIVVNIAMGFALLVLGVWFQSSAVIVLALASFSMGLGQIVPVPPTDGWILLQIFRDQLTIQ